MFIMSFLSADNKLFWLKWKRISHTSFPFMLKLQRTRVNISRHVLQETPQIFLLTCVCVCVCV